MKALDRPNWVWLVAALAVVGLGVMVFQGREPACAQPPPSDLNGIEDFYEAAKFQYTGVWSIQQWALNPKVVTPPHKGELELLKERVEGNQPLLARLRLGLSRDCRVPLRLAKGADFMGNVNLMTIQELKQELLAEARLAEIQRDYSHTANSYLDMLRLGEAIGRGGLVLDRYGARFCDDAACAGVRTNAARLTRSELRQIIRELEGIESKSEPVDDVVRRTRRFRSLVYSWKENLEWRWNDYGTLLQTKVDRYYGWLLNRLVAQRRLLLLELAVRCYQLESGRLPASLTQLMPSPIASLPEDPFNSGGFIYRTNATGYLLYSIGPDGKDDGGAKLVVPANHGIPTGDVLPQ